MMLGGWIPGKVTTIAARSGVGKCLGYGTLVVLSDGSLKPVQELKVDDCLLGIDGKPNKIVSTVSGKDNMFRIHQSKGISYEVNSVHMLSLTDGTKKVNIPLNEFLAYNTNVQYDLRGYKEVGKFPEKELEFPPYLLGLWLGDGKSTGTIIYNVDQEVLDYCLDYHNLPNTRVQIRQAKTVKQIEFTSETTLYTGHGATRYKEPNYFKQFLLKYDLWNNKHIPLIFLTASQEQRLELLAGLIDTDGSVASGGYEITQKNKQLSDQIVYLCDSLGFTTHQSVKVVRGVTYFRLYISGNGLNEIPVRISRKILALKDIRNKSLSRIKVEPLGIGDYYGFTLENEDRRFFLSDFTVTHNTALTVPMFDAAGRVQNGKRAEFLFFTWEMESSYLVDRQVCYKVGITNHMLTQGAKLFGENTWDKVKGVYRDVEKLPVLYQEMSTNINVVSATVLEFVQQCKEKEKVEGIKIQPVVVVDYIGMAQFEGSGLRTYGIADFMNGAKKLANQTGASFCIFAQINRGADEKDTPQRSDISDSQSIEMASDNLVLLHRPEYNNIATITDPATGDQIESKNKMLLRVLKGRDFGTGDALVNCEIKYYRFWDMDHSFDTKYWELYQKKEFWLKHFGL